MIDLHKYWDAVKPLIFAPQLSLLALYRHTIIWLAVALQLEALIAPIWRRLAVLVFIAGVLFARIIIAGIVLSPAEVLGGALAALLWTVLLSRLGHRAAIVALLFAGVVVLQRLSRFNSVPPRTPSGGYRFAASCRVRSR